MMKFGFTMGIAMGSVATVVLLQKNKLNKFIRKVKGTM